MENNVRWTQFNEIKNGEVFNHCGNIMMKIENYNGWNAIDLETFQLRGCYLYNRCKVLGRLPLEKFEETKEEVAKELKIREDFSNMIFEAIVSKL